MKISFSVIFIFVVSACLAPPDPHKAVLTNNQIKHAEIVGQDNASKKSKGQKSSQYPVESSEDPAEPKKVEMPPVFQMPLMDEVVAKDPALQPVLIKVEKSCLFRDGQIIRSGSCMNSSSFTFSIESIPGLKDVRVMDVSKRMCLDLLNSTTAVGTSVNFFECNKTTAQSWTIQKNESEGSFQLKSTLDETKCVAFSPKSPEQAPLSTIQDCSSNPNQQFTALDANLQIPKAEILTVKSTGKCLDVLDGSLRENAIVQQRACAAGESQLLNIVTASSGYVSLQMAKSGKCIGVPDYKVLRVNQPDTIVNHGSHQTTCGNINSEWKMKAVGSSLQFESKKIPGKCLEIDPNMPLNRATGLVLNCSMASSQLFVRTPITRAFKAQVEPAETIEDRCTAKIMYYDHLVLKASNAKYKVVMTEFGGSIDGAIKKIADQSKKLCLLYGRRPEQITNVRYIDVFVSEDTHAAGYVWIGGVPEAKILSIDATHVSEASYNPKSYFRFLTHELAHVWQAFAKKSYAKMRPGMTEGFAVAMQDDVKNIPADDEILERSGTDWDAGYGKTGGILLFINLYSADFLYRLNEDIRTYPGEWTPERFKVLTGKSIEDWWVQYQNHPNCPPKGRFCSK
jgi:hypothetical protein